MSKPLSHRSLGRKSGAPGFFVIHGKPCGFVRQPQKLYFQKEKDRAFRRNAQSERSVFFFLASLLLANAMIFVWKTVSGRRKNDEAAR